MRRARKWTDEELFVVADKYYNQQKTQEEIAREIKRRRQDVAMMLRDAETAQIVRINVIRPDDRGHVRELENALCQRFPILKEVIVTPRSTEFEDMAKQFGVEAGISCRYYPQPTVEAGKYLTDQVNMKPNRVAAIGYGIAVMYSTLYFVFEMEKNSHNRATVVPIVGNVDHFSLNFNAEYLAHMVAIRLLDVDCSDFPVPAYLTLEQREVISQVPLIARALKFYDKVDMAITEVGSMPPHTHTAARRERLRSQPIPIAGEISGYVFARDGEALPDEYQPFGFGLDRLRSLANSQSGTSIAIACQAKSFDARFTDYGDEPYVIMSALLGGYYNVLITHEEMAEKILAAAQPGVAYDAWLDGYSNTPQDGTR